MLTTIPIAFLVAFAVFALVFLVAVIVIGRSHRRLAGHLDRRRGDGAHDYGTYDSHASSLHSHHANAAARTGAVGMMGFEDPAHRGHPHHGAPHHGAAHGHLHGHHDHHGGHGHHHHGGHHDHHAHHDHHHPAGDAGGGFSGHDGGGFDAGGGGDGGGGGGDGGGGGGGD